MCIWQSSCWYTALMSLGMMLIRANTLDFDLIGKDGPHRIIKICFGNMNLVFGSEVALLGFWEYMFQILFRVCWHGTHEGSAYSSVYNNIQILLVGGNLSHFQGSSSQIHIMKTEKPSGQILHFQNLISRKIVPLHILVFYSFGLFLLIVLP